MNKFWEIVACCAIIWLFGVIIAYAIKSYNRAENNGYGYYISFSDEDLFDIWLWPLVIVAYVLRLPFLMIETIAIHIKKTVDKINNPKQIEI